MAIKRIATDKEKMSKARGFIKENRLEKARAILVTVRDSELQSKAQLWIGQINKLLDDIHNDPFNDGVGEGQPRTTENRPVDKKLAQSPLDVDFGKLERRETKVRAKQKSTWDHWKYYVLAVVMIFVVVAAFLLWQDDKAASEEAQRWITQIDIESRCKVYLEWDEETCEAWASNIIDRHYDEILWCVDKIKEERAYLSDFEARNRCLDEIIGGN